MSKKITCTDEEKQALLVCVTEQEKIDQFIRERNIRSWKKAEEYWRLNQFIYWDEVALDYRDVTTAKLAEDDENEDLPPKTFGIYRAYGESLISAMSAAMPSVLFFPDDTQNPDDITTARNYSNISELIQKHNKSELLAIKSLTTLYNQGLVASHVNWNEDEKYGTRKIPKYKNEKVRLRSLDCPQCGEKFGNAPIGDEDAEPNSVEQDKQDEQSGQPKEEHPYLKDYKCDHCGYEGKPELGEEFDEIFQRLVDYSDTPKGRVTIDIYGPLHVRVSSYAKKQSDVGLLELQVEMDVNAAKDEFESISDKITASSDFYSYERWGRTSSELLSNTMFGQTTVRYCWLRTWTFQCLGEDKKSLRDSLKKKFPHGVCAIFVNDEFADAYDENLDDYWTLTESPLDSWIHALPMGKTMMDCQDAFNESENLNLTKQAFGIKETFVSTDLINEDAYRSQRSGAGYVTFVKGRTGEPISNMVTQIKTAELDEEEIQFGEHYNNLSQFLVGAVPSIWGGNQTSGSKTATEYTQSRAYALQRLNTNWILFKHFYADTMAKASRLYVQNLTEDEKFTKKNGNSQETIWIKRAELAGKLGSIEPDVSEQFPVTWAQRRDLMMQLITMQNPVIGEIMLHPNNAQNVKDALGFSEFFIPGEVDRTKQLIELRKLIDVSVEQGAQNYFPPDSEAPTVLPDEDADDNNVHVQVTKLWMVGEAGLFIKETNPAAYLNVVLHLRAHEKNEAMKAGGAPPAKVNNPQPKPNEAQ